MPLVSSEHPELDACIPEVLNAIRYIVLQLVFYASASDHIQILLTNL